MFAKLLFINQSNYFVCNLIVSLNFRTKSGLLFFCIYKILKLFYTVWRQLWNTKISQKLTIYEMMLDETYVKDKFESNVNFFKPFLISS